MFNLLYKLCFEGDEDSHSLLFESKYNWSGLLVEPIQIDVLKSKNRKSTLAPFCLATETRPHYVEFDIISAFEIDSGRNKRAMRGIVQVGHIDIQCQSIEMSDVRIRLQTAPPYSVSPSTPCCWPWTTQQSTGSYWT